MSDSTSSSDKSSDKSSSSKSKDSSSGDAAASKPADKGGDGGKPADKGGDGGKSAKESIGGATDVHYGFFSSVRTPAYRSGWDGIWGKEDSARPRKKGAKTTSKTNSKKTTKAGAKPVTAELKIDDLPTDIRDGLVEAARRKMRKSRSSYDKLEASGVVDWAISVTVNGGRDST